MRYELEMRHGHYPGWAPEEIYVYARSVVLQDNPLIQFGKPEIKGTQASVSYTASKKAAKSELLYTMDTGIWNQRTWEVAQAIVSGSSIAASVPEGASALFFTATDDRDLMVSSEFILLNN